MLVRPVGARTHTCKVKIYKFCCHTPCFCCHTPLYSLSHRFCLYIRRRGIWGEQTRGGRSRYQDLPVGSAGRTVQVRYTNGVPQEAPDRTEVGLSTREGSQVYRLLNRSYLGLLSGCPGWKSLKYSVEASIHDPELKVLMYERIHGTNLYIGVLKYREDSQVYSFEEKI